MQPELSPNSARTQPELSLNSPLHSATELNMHPAYIALLLTHSSTVCTRPTIPVLEMFTNLPSTRAGVQELSHNAVQSVEYPVDLQCPFPETYSPTLLLDSSQVRAKLGATLSGFSLSEQGQLPQQSKILAKQSRRCIFLPPNQYSALPFHFFASWTPHHTVTSSVSPS